MLNNHFGRCGVAADRGEPAVAGGDGEAEWDEIVRPAETMGAFQLPP